MTEIRVNSKLDNSEFVMGSKEMLSAIKALRTSMEGSAREIQRASSGYGEAMRRNIAVSRDAEREIQSLSNELDKMRANLDKPGTESKAFGNINEEIKRVEAEIDKAEKKIDSMTGKRGAGYYAKDLSEFTTEQARLKELQSKRDELLKRRESLSNPSDKDISAYQKQVAEIERMERALEELRQIKSESFKPPYVQQWQQMVTLTGMISNGFNGMRNAAGMALTALTHPLQALDRGLGYVVQKAAQVATSLAKMAGHAAVSFLRNLASTAVNAAIQLAKLAGNAILSGLQRIAIGAKDAALSLARLAASGISTGLHTIASAARTVAMRVAEIGGNAVRSALSGLGQLAARGAKSLLGLNRSLSQTKKGFARGLKTILKYAFGVRSLYFLFRKIRTAIKEGLGELAKKDPQLKTSIDNIKKSFNGLKGSLATAFSPIVTAVEPALVSLINLLTKAINTLGAFFAALTGKSVYYKSVGALDATGKSAKNASNSVKDLKKQLASFDDLDILKENDSNGSGSSGGYSFEETPIESDILDFVGRLKKMFEEGAWDELGHLIADGINSAIKKVQNWVKWENIGPTITKIMEGITGTINGIVDGVDWNNIGATLGDGFNTVVNTLELWWSGIDWENLGVQLGNGINSLIDRVDWDNLGNMLREKAEAFVGVIKGAVTTIKWGNAGRDLGIVLNRFFKDPEGKIWKDAGDTIDRTIKGMLDFGKKFLIEFEPEVVAEDIKTALGQIEWDDIANKLWEDAKLAFKAAGTFVTVLLGGGKKNLFGQTVVSDDWWNDLADELSKGFNSAIEKLTDFIKNFPVDKVVLELAAFFVRVKNGVRFDRLGTMLASGMNTALSAIGTAISAFEADAENLGGQLADAANAMVKAANLDGDDDGSLKTTITKAFKGAIHFVDAFMERFKEEDLANKIRNTLTGIPWASIASDVWSTIRTMFQKAGNFATVLLGGKLPKVDVDLPYGAWKTEQLTKQAKGMDTSEITNALADALTTGINNAVKRLNEFISGELKITDTVNAFTNFFDRVIDGISWRNLGDLFGTLIKKALDGLSVLMNYWSNESAKIGKTIGDFFNRALTYQVKWTGDNSVASFIEDGLRGAIGLIKGFFDTFDAKAFGQGLHDALFDPSKGVNWKGIAQDIWDAIVSALSQIADFATALFGGDADPAAKYMRKTPAGVAPRQISYASTDTASRFGSTLSDFIINALDGLKNIIEEADWSGLGTTIRTVLEAIDWTELANKIWEVFVTAVEDIIELLKGIYDLENFFSNYDEAQKSKEESRENALSSFDNAYKRDNEAALKAYGQAYGVNLEGLDYNEARRRIQIMNDGFLDGYDGLVIIGRELREQGRSFEDIQKELGLTAEQLKQVEIGSREKNVWGKLGELLTGKSYDQTNTVDFQKALAIANNPAAYNEVYNATQNGEIIRVAELMERFGLTQEEAIRIIDAATSAVHANTDATNSNTSAKLEVEANFGLDAFAFELIGDEIDTVIKNSLSNNELDVTALVALGLDDANIVEVEKEFINRWNLDHPEAPITLSIESFSKLSDLIGGAEAYRLLHEAGVDMSDAIAKGIKDGEINVKKSGESVVLEFKDGTVRKLNAAEKELYKEALETGEEVNNGLLAGIEKKAKTLSEKIGNIIVNGVITPAKEKLEVQSPSKVFEEIGRNTILGLINGVEDEKSGVSGAMNGVISVITGFANTFISSGKDAGKGLLDGIVQGAEENQSSITSRLSGVFSGIGSAVEGVKTGVKSFLSNLLGGNKNNKDTSNNVSADDIAKPYEDGSKRAQTALSSISDGVKKIADENKKYFSMMASDTKESFIQINAEANAMLTALAESIATRMLGVKNNFSTALDNIKTKASTTFSQINSDVNTKLTAMAANIAMRMLSVNNNFATSLQAMATTVSTKFSGIQGVVTTAISGATQAISVGFNSMNGAVITAMVGIQNSVSSGFTSVGNSVRYSMHDIQDSVANGTSGIGNSFSNAMGSLLRSIQNLGWYNVGGNIVNGIYRGFADIWPNMRNAVVNSAKNLLAAVKRTLGIHSPSTVFRDEVGVNIGLGVAEGIEDSEKSVLNSVIGMAQSMSDEMVKADLKASVDSATLTNGLDGALTNFSDKITDSFTMLADKLAAISERITFAEPAMATGAVIPYSVVNTTASSNEEIQNTLEANNEDLIQTIISVIGAQTTAIVAALQAVERSAGKSTLNTRQIINDINRNAQMFGVSPIKG